MKILFTWMTLLASVVCGLGYGGNTGSYGTVGSLPPNLSVSTLTATNASQTNVLAGSLAIGGSLTAQSMSVSNLTLVQPLNITNVSSLGISNGTFLTAGPNGTVVPGNFSTNISRIGLNVFYYVTNGYGQGEMIISNTTTANTFEFYGDGSIAIDTLNGGNGDAGNGSFAMINAVATNNSFAGPLSIAGVNEVPASDGVGYDFSWGQGAQAFGGNANAFGYGATASAPFSMALGSNTSATASNAVAVGFGALANGNSSMALGTTAYAYGDYSIALGGVNTVVSAGKSIGISPQGTPLSVTVSNSVSIGGTNGITLNGGTNGVSIIGRFWLATNTIVAAPAPLPNGDWLWNSNHVLYWVTTTHTNYISGP